MLYSLYNYHKDWWQEVEPNNISFKSGSGVRVESMENHLEMTKTSKESIYGIRRDAEETDTIGENSRGKSILKEKQVFSQRKKWKELSRKEFENIENVAIDGPWVATCSEKGVRS